MIKPFREFIFTDINNDGTTDLCRIQINSTGSGKSELHVLSGNTYNTYNLHVATALSKTEYKKNDYCFADYNNDGKKDLIVVSKYGNQSNFKEISIYSGNNFTSALISSKSIGIAEYEKTNISEEIEQISDNWVATDNLGRKLPDYSEVGGIKNKKIGLFYFIWHSRWSNNDPKNITAILKKNPDAIDDISNSSGVWGNIHEYHWWNEPLFGYYKSTDKWVLRKHAEMLADAGVDFVAFDLTNARYTYQDSYEALFEVWSEAQGQGVKVPQIVFMVGWNVNTGQPHYDDFMSLYDNIYSKSKYKSLWFYLKGKPHILYSPRDLIKNPDDESITNLHNDIRRFFTFRPVNPFYKSSALANASQTWAWLETYPQNGYNINTNGEYEQVAVGVAQNANDNSVSATAMTSEGTYGRSYTYNEGQNNEPSAYLNGLNFQEQWERAFELDPEIVFITSWNEWIAMRFEGNRFVDSFNNEKSRDIEPMKGGFGDNYYYQMIELGILQIQ